jgi:hypothetical protein
MVVMLWVVGMTIYWTRDPGMWKWLADDVQDDAVATDKSSKDSITAEMNNEETLVTGPNDRQPFEQSQAEYLFQAITDKEPLAREEMSAYWKLMRWSMTESFEDLWERSRKDVYFTHLAEAPQKYRGELIGLKVSLRRALAHEAEKNSAGAKQVFEAWGVTNESRSGLYCFVFYDKPPELAIQPSIHEEATFVGYFLKQFSYEDAMGKKRWAPLLIGRLRWRENLTRTALRRQRNDGNHWQWLVVAGGVIVLVIAWKRSQPSPSHGLGTIARPDHAAIESWLDDGAPEVLSRPGGIPAEWETTDNTDTASHPVTPTNDPRNSRSGDAPTEV